MLVTLFGIVTEVKLLHSAKALSPMLVTLLGITIVPEAAAEQPSRVVFVSSLYTR